MDGQISPRTNQTKTNLIGPSGNQAWQWKSPALIDRLLYFPIYINATDYRRFPIAMFAYRRVVPRPKPITSHLQLCIELLLQLDRLRYLATQSVRQPLIVTPHTSPNCIR